MADETPADPGEGVPTELVLDAGSFNSAERMECQARFDAPFGDLLRSTFEAVDLARPDMPFIATSRDGTPCWPDQVLQFMVWVQAKRTDPDAKLEDFDNLTLRELQGARVRGALGKALTGGTSATSSPGSRSAGSSPG